MDGDGLYKLLSGLGSSGVVAWVLWIVAKRFIEEHSKQVQITQDQMSKRIDATEKRNDECEEDRKVLHSQLIQVMRETKQQ